jgi:hypothetical protein
MLHYLLGKQYHIQGLVIAVSIVVALAKNAAANKHPIHSVGKGAEDKVRVNPAGTHDADKSHLGCIL